MTADTIGGVWNYSLTLIRALQDFDVHVHLATMGKAINKQQWEQVKKLKNLTVHESDYALEWMENPWNEVDEAGKWLLKLEDQIEPDLIHLNSYAHGNLNWSAPVLMVNHSCVLSWWKAVLGEEAPSDWEMYGNRVQAGLQSADLVVSITHSMLRNVQKYYGPLKNCKVIYNGCDSSDFFHTEKKNLIFSMGRLWDDAKNVFCLQQIAPQLQWPVHVAGDDGGRLRSQQTANFKLTGQLSSEDVRQHLAQSSIYVMPARYEPFGLSILEAALSRCALVLGDIPTLRELWDGAAFFANPEDPQHFREQIKKLITQPELRMEMAEKAFERAKRYSLQKMQKEYWESYLQLLNVHQLQAEIISA